MIEYNPWLLIGAHHVLYPAGACDSFLSIDRLDLCRALRSVVPIIPIASVTVSMSGDPIS